MVFAHVNSADITDDLKLDRYETHTHFYFFTFSITSNTVSATYAASSCVIPG